MRKWSRKVIFVFEAAQPKLHCQQWPAGVFQLVRFASMSAFGSSIEFFERGKKRIRSRVLVRRVRLFERQIWRKAVRSENEIERENDRPKSWTEEAEAIGVCNASTKSLSMCRSSDRDSNTRSGLRIADTVSAKRPTPWLWWRVGTNGDGSIIGKALHSPVRPSLAQVRHKSFMRQMVRMWRRGQAKKNEIEAQDDRSKQRILSKFVLR